MDVDGTGTKRVHATAGDDDDACCAWCSSAIGIFSCDTVVLRLVFPFAHLMCGAAEFCTVNCMFSYVCTVAVPAGRSDVRARLALLLAQHYQLAEVTRCDEITRRPYNICIVCAAPLGHDGGALGSCSPGCDAVVRQSLLVQNDSADEPSLC